MVSDLTEAMLAVNSQPSLPSRVPVAGTTVEVAGDRATVEFPRGDGESTDTAAYRYLQTKGEDPDDWVVTGFRSSEWTMANGEIGESMRYTFARRGSAGAPYPIDEVLAWVDGVRRPAWIPAPPRQSSGGFLFLIGDTQWGKIDGDGIDGTLERALRYIDDAVSSYRVAAETHNIVEVTIAWLGDHGEGFVSQNGANVWRTTLTNTEQQRLTRRVMAYAIKRFAEVVPSSIPINVVAVPGNHGETVRFAGKGTTRYSDSYDTEALVAVADALELAGGYENVKTFVPTNDEMVVVLDVADTRVGFVHGHQHKPGKHFEWLTGQAFNKRSPLRDVDVLVEGHLHHYHVDTRNGVTFIGIPAVESESTWFRHRTGITGDPGAVVAIVADGNVLSQEVIR